MQVYKREKHFHEIGRYLILWGGILVVLGAVVLAGWLLGIKALTVVRTGYLPTPPVNALFFILFGISFILKHYIPEKKISRELTCLLFGILTVYGFLQFLGYFFNADLTLNRFVFPITEKLGEFSIKYMSPGSGLFFFLSGTAILLKMTFRNRKGISNLISGIGILISFAGFVSGLGYMYGTPFLYIGHLITLSTFSTVSFFFLGSGLIILAGEDNIFLRQFAGPTASARLLRTYVPLLVILFVLEGLAISFIRRRYPVNDALLLALLAISTGILSIIIIVNVTRKIFESANEAEIERLNALKELKKVNALQDHILDNNVMGIFMERGHVIQWANERLGEIFLIPVRKLIGKSTRAFLSQEEMFEIPEAWYQSITRGRNMDQILQLKRRDGEYFWCRFIGTSLDSDKPDDGTVWMIEDITERKKLRDRMRLLSHAVEGLSECICISDTGDRIIFVNEAFQTTYGYSQEELLGKSHSIVISPEYDQKFLNSFFQATMEGSWRGNMNNQRKDGSKFPVNSVTSRVFDDKGEMVALVTISSDISETQKAQNQLKKYAEELKASNNAKDKLFSIISHDLRNPFTTLLGFSQLLDEQYSEFSEAEKISFIQEIRKASENTFNLLENLLTWSRTQTGGIQARPALFDVAELLQQHLIIQQNTASLKRIDLSFKIPKGIMAYADPDMVKTILLNLTSNAIKFTRTKGVITITATVQKDTVQIEVADNGIGMTPSDVESIFRIDKSRSKPGTSNEKGTGLGLLICKEFVERNGGKIRVESEQNKGSRFIFTLPQNKRA
jgi:PAS domain S-box-containing protein